MRLVWVLNLVILAPLIVLAEFSDENQPSLLMNKVLKSLLYSSINGAEATKSSLLVAPLPRNKRSTKTSTAAPPYTVTRTTEESTMATEITEEYPPVSPETITTTTIETITATTEESEGNPSHQRVEQPLNENSGTDSNEEDSKGNYKENSIEKYEENYEENSLENNEENFIGYSKKYYREVLKMMMIPRLG